MSTVAEKLQKWSVQELNLASESGLKRIPDVESLRAVTKGKHKRLWTYVINHVRSQATVDKVKRTLQIKKLLEQNEGDSIAFNDESTDVIKLQAAISKATEKRAYLMQSLSTVKERILNLEGKVQNTKDETFQINQKTALLELVKQLYVEKNINLRALFTQILACKDSLNAYQATKVCDKAVMALPHDFLFEYRALYDKHYSRIKDIINLSSSILKNNFFQQNDDALIEKFQNNIHALKKNGVLLTDLVILLKEIGGSDLQHFTNMKSVSVTDFMHDKSKKTESNVLLSKLKCDHLYNSLSSIRNREKIEKLLLKKEKIYENKVKSHLDEVKCTLIEKLAENDALTISNNYLENNLEHMSIKTHLILKKIRQQKLSCLGLNSLIQTFYSNADIVFYLLYTHSDSIQKTVDNLNSLQLFAQKDLFESPFPRKECLEEIKVCLVRDRKRTWEYCVKTNCIQPLLPEPHIFNLSSSEIQKSLCFQPFQNIGVLCEYWMQFKWKLHAEVIAQSEVFMQNTDISVPELYTKILQLLEKMEVSIEKAVLYVNDGMTHCQKNKSLIQEWWDQNAQYIPDIEYEGKTLKMWIDILSVLSDFEPQSCA